MARGIKNPTSTILAALREATTDEAKAVAFLEQHRRYCRGRACARVLAGAS